MRIDNLDFDGTAVTVRRVEVERTSVLQKLGTVYDQHAKLVFLFDCSGSMFGRVAKTFTEQYVWTDAILADIKARAAAACLKANQVMSHPMAALMGGGLTADEEMLTKLADLDDGSGLINFNPKDDEDLKERIVRANLIGGLGIAVDFTKRHQVPITRMELVKKLAKSELENRFKKFPGSHVAVLPFGTVPVVMFDDGKEKDLWPELDKLCISYNGTGEGTDILTAINAAVEVCRAKPSPVGIHHIIIVSDGEDGTADRTIGTWVPSLKASGVVMDYIHIGDSPVAEGLKKACHDLSGEFCVVNSEREF